MQFKPLKFTYTKMNNIIILTQFEAITFQKVLNVVSVFFLFETFDMY